MSGVVRGVEHQAAADTRHEIAIGNGTKTTDGPTLYVFSHLEEYTDIIGRVKPSSVPEDFIIDGNLVYVGYEKKYSTGIAVAGTCSGCIPTPISNSTYYALKIKITGSPASIVLKEE